MGRGKGRLDVREQKRECGQQTEQEHRRGGVAVDKGRAVLG